MVLPIIKGFASITTSPLAIAAVSAQAAARPQNLLNVKELSLSPLDVGPSMLGLQGAQWTHFGARNPYSRDGKFNEIDPDAKGINIALGNGNSINYLNFTNSMGTESNALLWQKEHKHGNFINEAMRWNVGTFMGPVTGYPNMPLAPYVGLNLGLTDRGGNGVQFSFMPGSLLGQPNVGIMNFTDGSHPLAQMAKAPMQNVIGAFANVAMPFLSMGLEGLGFLNGRSPKPQAGMAADGRLNVEHFVENMRKAQNLAAGRNAGRAIGGTALAAAGVTGPLGAVGALLAGFGGEKAPPWLKRMFTKPGSTPPKLILEERAAGLAELLQNKFSDFDWRTANRESIIAHANNLDYMLVNSNNPEDKTTKQKSALFSTILAAEIKLGKGGPMHDMLEALAQAHSGKPEAAAGFFEKTDGGLSAAAQAAQQGLLNLAGGKDSKPEDANFVYQTHLKMWKGASRADANKLRQEAETAQVLEAKRPQQDWQNVDSNMTVTLRMDYRKTDRSTESYLVREMNGQTYYLGKGDTRLTADEFTKRVNEASDKGELAEIVMAAPKQEFLAVRADAKIAELALNNSMRGKLNAEAEPLQAKMNAEPVKVADILNDGLDRKAVAQVIGRGFAV